MLKLLESLQAHFSCGWKIKGRFCFGLEAALSASDNLMTASREKAEPNQRGTEGMRGSAFGHKRSLVKIGLNCLLTA